MLEKTLQKLERWVQKLERRAQDIRNVTHVEPARFGDPVALLTDWKPIRVGRSRFPAYKLSKVNPNRVEIRSTFRSVILSLMLFMPGVGLLIYTNPVFNRSLMTSGAMVPLLIGIILASCGGYLFYTQMFPVVFDKKKDCFWQRRQFHVGMNKEAANNCVRLGLIHALQIIADYHNDPETGHYFLYELNLVMKNGARINIIDHSDRKKLVECAEALAEFLGISIWDATVYYRLPID